MKKITCSTLVILLCSLFVACNNKQPDTQKTSSCDNIVDGIDTTRYKIVYNKDGGLMLVDRAKFADTAFLTEPIPPANAVAMISNHVSSDIRSQGGRRVLQANKTRSVDFNINTLITIFSRIPEPQRPDFMRIYFGEYDAATTPPTHPSYRGKTSLLLVGVKGTDELEPIPGSDVLNPVNIGTLCPPDCQGEPTLSNTRKGSIYLKQGAIKAGAQEWIQ